jgi:excisionase family DNA binding protein
MPRSTPAEVPCQFLDVPGTAQLLGTSVSHVRKLVLRRGIPYVKIGGLIRFHRADLDAWLDANRVEVEQ